MIPKILKRTTSRKWSMKLYKKDLKAKEFRPPFSDKMAKAFFGTEQNKHYLTFLLSEILNKKIEKEELSFYKNDIAPSEVSASIFQCDIPVIYQGDTLLLLEFNNSSDLIYVIRNIVYLFLIFYQLLKAKRKKQIDKVYNVWLININNFVNSRNYKSKEHYFYKSFWNLIFTKKVQTLEYYLPIAIKKYYTDGIKKEKLSRLERLIVASYKNDIEEAKKILEGDDFLMCMLDEIHKLSHAKDQFTYYHSMEEEKEASYIKGYDVGEKKGLSIGRNEGISIGRNEGISIGRNEGISIGRNEGISIGRNEGREEAYMEMAKAFGIPYEEIKAKTKSLKKQKKK